MPKTTQREKLLAAGYELLFDRGYEETGVQKITAASGVPKGSFYYYFESKEAFALAVIARYLDAIRGSMDYHLVDGAGSPLTRLRCLLTTWADQLERGAFARGCLAGNLSQEMAAKNPTFQRTLVEGFAGLERRFETCLEASRNDGELASSADPHRLAAFILNGWQGAMLRMKVSKNRAPLDDFIDILFGHVLHR